MGYPDHRRSVSAVHHGPRDLPRLGGLLAGGRHGQTHGSALLQSAAPCGLGRPFDDGAGALRLGQACAGGYAALSQSQAWHGADSPGGAGVQCVAGPGGLGASDGGHFPGAEDWRRGSLELCDLVLGVYRPAQRRSGGIQSLSYSAAGRLQNSAGCAAGPLLRQMDAL